MAKYQLNDYKRMFAQLFDYLEQPVAMVDTGGFFVYLNQKMADYDNRLPEDAVGMHVLEYWPYYTAETSTLLRAAKYGERFINHLECYAGADGKILDYLHSTLPIFDQDGRVLGAVDIGSGIDNITALTNQVLNLSEQLYARSDTETGQSPPEIITVNANMLRAIDALDLYARRDIPLLIYGETGTGKELFVQRAHQKSSRANKPMITLNCAAIPETLMEGMLFGTKKGAFTGSENRKGIFDIADGGTVFLDELNSMPLGLQAKLLRVLQEGEFMGLGSTVSKKVNVRVITAMNEPPVQAIRAGRLRQDLYYRISVGLICVPSLRERRDDIGVLGDYFVRKYSSEYNCHIDSISPKVKQIMESYDWPGNVRMLQNAIRRSLLLEASHQGARPPVPPHLRKGMNGYSQSMLNIFHLEVDHLQPLQAEGETPGKQAANGDQALSLPEMMDAYERDLICAVLKKSNGNVLRAARLLQIPRSTLQHKIKNHRLEIERAGR
jgi:arginine utilization regulatory protein